ncbi:FAD-dependent oxidoreductase [Paraburkholderia caballeronis]|uniref:FAD-dependent oxidoreductase n=1 Tax=Paraburkholderia caballeronis TaxID=416943 RepID=UPI0010DC5997|nr:FAD-dependent oxidoreductase [Paraburkholderia caballeronis]TDV15671.1 thioredoxin reductase [Paraburkholderia caballeronis]TDV17926.1 thioredoxin reductase [Paraburkholderia caballeronis]TDV26460.1 thioredoxin reductase [Paraburkholderia caballeronis]
MTDTIPIQFDGDTLHARPGETLAATLIAHGVQTFRTTGTGAPRGVFCGMGVCQDCLVEIDGVANRRACMTKIDRPLTVRSGAQSRPLPAVVAGAGTGAAAVFEAPRIEVREPQVLVIGAGPGGLSAALAARRAGASVTVLDERSQAGGQYYKQLGVDAAAQHVPGADRQHARGAQLIAAARDAGVQIVSDALVWGAFEPREFVATVGGRSVRFRPAAAIVATGAYERGWQVPGWTLPGVMTTGAAQTLWRTSRRLPGRRVLIAGNGPLNLQLAAELTAGGAQVVAVVEAARAPAPRDVRALLTMAFAAPALIAEGLRYRRIARGANVELIHAQVIESIAQGPDGLEATLAGVAGQPGGRRFVVDAVCLGYGFEPANELLRALGCEHTFDEKRRQLATRRDDDGQTTIERVYALGDCTGLGGAKAALAEGTLVGLAVARSLGLGRADAGADRARARAARELATQRRFQRALWTLYAGAQPRPAQACGDTLICRCEEVSFATLDAALAEGLSTVGAIKRRTRIGMGRCQGRYCAPVLDEIVCERYGRARDEMSGFAPRVPVKPVSIAELAGRGDAR